MKNSKIQYKNNEKQLQTNTSKEETNFIAWLREARGYWSSEVPPQGPAAAQVHWRVFCFLRKANQETQYQWLLSFLLQCYHGMLYFQAFGVEIFRLIRNTNFVIVAWMDILKASFWGLMPIRWHACE